MKHPELEWLVIGAGPAGIASVGKLLDHGIEPKSIGWLDPAFGVGDFGAKWQHVPSNTKVEFFLRFLHECKAFDYQSHNKRFPIDEFDPNQTCLLKEIVAPLQEISDRLVQKVQAVKGCALTLNLVKKRWEAKTDAATLYATNVILAVGSEEKRLEYSFLEAVPLDVALDYQKLAQQVKKQDMVAVFGSSHSAVLALANLAKLHVKGVYNFYRAPHIYAVPMGDWILFDNTGLKGYAAEWAREHLDGALPPHFKRLLVNDPSFEQHLAHCTKAIYAVGFERRRLPIVEHYASAPYQETTGIIAPGLFGIGIAFPQMQFDRLGNREYQVGLWKFMDYLNFIFPIWFRYAHLHPAVS